MKTSEVELGFLALPEGGREADAAASVSAGFDYTP